MRSVRGTVHQRRGPSCQEFARRAEAVPFLERREISELSSAVIVGAFFPYLLPSPPRSTFAPGSSRAKLCSRRCSRVTRAPELTALASIRLAVSYTNVAALLQYASQDYEHRTAFPSFLLFVVRIRHQYQVQSQSQTARTVQPYRHYNQLDNK